MPNPAAPAHTTEPIARLLAEIERTYAADISLSRMAAFAGFTPPYFSAYFRKTVGIGFAEYLRERRMLAAGSLLQSSDKTVSEICFACGFRNLSHFLRTFRQFYGMTPKVYRQTHRKP